MRPVCVIGLGLIGGSVLRAAQAGGREVWGATASADDAVAARTDGFAITDSVKDALVRVGERDAIVVVAVPLPAVDEVLAQVAEVVPECWLTDVVSVKSPVLSSVRRIVPGARFAGGHPMAGSEESGWAAGSATLFGRAAWVVGLEDDTSLGTWRVMAQLALDCGAGVVATMAAEHDDAVARISHLPHVLAAVLAAAGAEGGPLALALAAGSFADGTRVAGARAELTAAMCEGNRGPLLAALDDALGKLGVARGALASTGSLRSTLRAGNAARAELVHFRTGPRETAEVDLTGPDAAERLRELGRRGGRIVRFDGDRAIAEVSELAS